MPKTRFLLAGFCAVAISATCAHAQIQGEVTTARDLIEQMDQYYQRVLPDTKPETVKGSGYKPFKRYEWFMETRLGNDADIPVGARGQAFDKLQEMSARGSFPSWFSLGPTNVAGRCLAIAVDPTNSNIVYAGFASGGIWKTTDGGVSWTPLGDNLPSMSVSALALDESNPSTIYMGTGEGWGNVDAIHGVGILKSTDGGATWNTTGFTYAIASGLDVFRLEYEETTGVLLVAAENGLWRSTDGAATFTEVMESGDWRDVKLKPGTTDTYYAISRGWTGQRGYKSTDGGVTWTQMAGGAPNTGVGNGRLAVTPANPNYVYWSFDVAGAGIRIYRSTDSGANWTQRSSVVHDGGLGQGWYDLSIAVDPQDADIVTSGGVELYRSTNGATSFSQIATNVHVDHHEAVYDPSDPERMWVGSDGGVYLSSNGGQSFIPRNTGLVTLQFYAMNQSMTSTNLAFGGTQDNGTWRFLGSPSFGQVLGGDGFECEISLDNQLVFAEVYNGFHYRSTTGGSGFTPSNSGISEDGPWQTPTHMDYSSNTTWTGHNAQIWRTTNNGGSWGSVLASGLGGGRSIDQSYNNPDYVYCIGGARIFRSTDHGASFTQMAQLSVGNTLTDITVHPDNPDIAMVCTGSYSGSVPRVLRTTDGGTNWTDMTNNLPGEGAQSITYKYDEPNIVFLGTDLGCYVSFNEGGTWEPFNVGLPFVICDDLRWHPDNFLRVGTHGRGMWEVDITGLAPSTAVDDATPEVSPLTMRVLGNPAGPNVPTSIRFGLREAGRAKIGLYDTNGRLVSLLLDREVEAKVDFIDIHTNSLPSGVYFVRLDVGPDSVTQKLVVKR